MAALQSDLVLTPLGGKERSIAEQLTMFQLVAVILDPYTYESSWLLETAGRILTEFAGADCRVAWVVTADEADTRKFLGPWADRMMTFCDPDRKFVAASGATNLPALVHIAHDGSVLGLANGWEPAEWRAITEQLAKDMSWSKPAIPSSGDPVAFQGSPA